MSLNEVIDLCDSDDDIPNVAAGAGAGGASAAPSTTPVPKRPRRSAANGNGSSTSGGVFAAPPSDDDEIEVVSFRKRGDNDNASPPKADGGSSATGAQAAADGSAANPTLGDDDELTVVCEVAGVRANVDYAHMRFSCEVHLFSRGGGVGVQAKNRLHCAKCYCYVCDVEASACTQWGAHCCATDKIPRWRSARARAKNRAQGGVKKKSRDFFVQRTPPVVNNRTPHVPAPRRQRISPSAFQESVLAIIGQQPNIAAAHNRARSRTTSTTNSTTPHAAQLADTLDALDQALMLRCAPLSDMMSINLPPLGDINRQAPHSAPPPGGPPSHRTHAPLPSPNSVMPPPLSAPPSTAPRLPSVGALAPPQFLLNRNTPNVARPPLVAASQAQPSSSANLGTSAFLRRTIAQLDMRQAPNIAPAVTPSTPTLPNIGHHIAQLDRNALSPSRPRIRPTFDASPRSRHSSPRLAPLAPIPVSLPLTAPAPAIIPLAKPLHVEPQTSAVAVAEAKSSPIEQAASIPVAQANNATETPALGDAGIPQDVEQWKGDKVVVEDTSSPMQGISHPDPPPPVPPAMQRREQQSSPASSSQSAESVTAAEQIRIRAQAAAIEPLTSMVSAGLRVAEPHPPAGDV